MPLEYTKTYKKSFADSYESNARMADISRSSYFSMCRVAGALLLLPLTLHRSMYEWFTSSLRSGLLTEVPHMSV
jgi:hypothetical protein